MRDWGGGPTSCWEEARLCSSSGSRMLNQLYHDLPISPSLLLKRPSTSRGSPPSQGTSPLPNQSSAPKAILHSPPGYSSPEAVFHPSGCPVLPVPFHSINPQGIDERLHWTYYYRLWLFPDQTAACDPKQTACLLGCSHTVSVGPMGGHYQVPQICTAPSLLDTQGSPQVTL